MRVAFFYDHGNADGTIGGAELTMQEFATQAPEGVEIANDDFDAAVVGNCVTFGPELIERLRGRPVYRYHHDLARHESPELREWLERNATHIFTSPLHQRLYDMDGVWPNVPPAIDLERFKPPRQSRKRREGACAIGSWQNPGKGQQLIREWSDAVEPVDVWGGGRFIPRGPNLTYCGPCEPDEVAQTLWRYERFIHLPTSPEPFGRTVVEAWAAGCKLIVNRQVGALHYIENGSEALSTAAPRFWEIVTRVGPLK